MRRFEVICGGALPAKAHDEETTIRLDVDGPGKNVNCTITDLPRTMLGDVPDVLLDLFDVAAYVHCADQRMPRGSDKLTDYGRDWRRDIHFTIPLRQPERWLDPAVRDVLIETLNFLADETYSFDFKRANEPVTLKQHYFSELIDATDLPHEVAMFSGGIDSLAGTVHDLVENGKSLLLVGHRSSEKVYKVQRTLVEHLKLRGFSNQLFYAPVNVTNARDRPVEFTQRPRSFLFACLGLIVAQMIRKDSFTFYENGVVAINLPIAGDVLGGRATRTMHPKVLRGFEDLFSVLLERTIKIRTPFQWLTKKDVLKTLERCGAGEVA